MNEPFEALIATLQQELGAIHSCECMYMAHEISEDLGDFVRDGQTVSGYTIDHGNAQYLFWWYLAPAEVRASQPGRVHPIDDPYETDSEVSARGRLFKRLRTLTWRDFPGELPSAGSPLEAYPEGGESNPPDCAADFYEMTQGETKLQEAFLDSGEFLGGLDEALKVYDEFNGCDYATRSISLYHRPRHISLEFSKGRVIKFERGACQDDYYKLGLNCSGGGSSDVTDHSCCRAPWTLTTFDGRSAEVPDFDSLVNVLEAWPEA